MSVAVRQSPRLLQRLLRTRSGASETPIRSANVTKRQIQLTTENFHDRLIKRRKDFIDSAVEAVSIDRELSSVINSNV